VGSHIRVVSMAIVRRPDDGSILVGEDSDDDGMAFQRPLGGTVEFGEASSAAVEREFMEELGLELKATRLLGVMENMFVLNGTKGHEVVFLWEGVFADPSAYQIENLKRLDEGSEA
jgi:ADP-ribose pyrophosphatase YjhB (NUDIX family)